MRSIALWSGPRTLSTAFMYFFAHRGDFKVLDEPFFGVFLKESGRIRPSRDEALAAMDLDPNSVHQFIEKEEKLAKALFLKNMANHWPMVNQKIAVHWPAIILFRDPRFVFHSYHRQMESFDLVDLGYALQVEILEQYQKLGQKVYLQCSEELALQPERELTKLCKFFDLTFNQEMLSWPKGALKEDGIWAKYWYQSVHQSEGFQAKAAKAPPPILERDRDLYQETLKKAYDEQV